MDFVDPERGQELLDRARKLLSEDFEPPDQPRRFSYDELHELMASWGFVEEPLEPDTGTAYIRYAPEYPDLGPLIIEAKDPVGDLRLERAVSMVEAVQRREGFETPVREENQ